MVSNGPKDSPPGPKSNALPGWDIRQELLRAAKDNMDAAYGAIQRGSEPQLPADLSRGSPKSGEVINAAMEYAIHQFATQVLEATVPLTHSYPVQSDGTLDVDMFLKNIGATRDSNVRWGLLGLVIGRADFNNLQPGALRGAAALLTQRYPQININFADDTSKRTFSYTASFVDS